MFEEGGDEAYEKARLQLDRNRTDNERYALELERRRLEVTTVREQAFQAAGHAVQFSKMGLQGLGYLNGGALFVLPAFTQLFQGGVALSALVAPMSAFIVGLVLTFIAILFAYLSTGNAAQQGHATADMNDSNITAHRLSSGPNAIDYEEKITELNSDVHASWKAAVKYHKKTYIFEILAIAVALMSLVAFIVGAWSGAGLLSASHQQSQVGASRMVGEIVIDPKFGE
jgi:hypothetical protein